MSQSTRPLAASDDALPAHAGLREALIAYLEVYFVKRDLQGTLALFHPHLTGFGTGSDEVAYDRATLAGLYARDLAEAPNPVHYNIRGMQTQPLSESVGVVSCELDIYTRILAQTLRLNRMRLTTVWSMAETGWKLAHMHISLPTEVHSSNESYPLKELEARNVVLQRLVDERTEKLHEALQAVSQQAATDKLTGLYNRSKIDECLELEVYRSRRYQHDFSIILLDIDQFKYVNDTFGHLVGDQLLTAFSREVSARLRRIDLMGRWGGDEFVILCPETSQDGAQLVAEDVRRLVALYRFPVVEQATVSLGVASLRDGDEVPDLIHRADEALYAAKRGGRNRVVGR